MYGYTLKFPFYVLSTFFQNVNTISSCQKPFPNILKIQLAFLLPKFFLLVWHSFLISLFLLYGKISDSNLVEKKNRCALGNYALISAFHPQQILPKLGLISLGMQIAQFSPSADCGQVL